MGWSIEFRSLVEAQMARRGVPSQAALARQMGWSRSSLHDYLSGRREPGVGVLAQLAVALDCEIGELLPPARTILEASAED